MGFICIKCKRVFRTQRSLGSHKGHCNVTRNTNTANTAAETPVVDSTVNEVDLELDFPDFPALQVEFLHNWNCISHNSCLSTILLQIPSEDQQMTSTNSHLSSSSSESEESDSDENELCSSEHNCNSNSELDLHLRSIPLYARGFCHVPKLSVASAAFLGLISELNLSTRQADAVSLFHNEHLDQRTPKDARSLKNKVEGKTVTPGVQFNKALRFTVPRGIGIPEACIEV